MIDLLQQLIPVAKLKLKYYIL